MDSFNLPPMLLKLPRHPVMAVAFPLVLGLASGYPTRNIVKTRWYKSLRAPQGSPPRQAFAIVWPILYMAMGYASHLAVNTLDTSSSPLASRSALDCLKLYYTQLALNLAWSPIFFVHKRMGLAVLDILALLATSCKLTMKLGDITNGKSTWFLAPYCAWLVYATYLNTGYWWLNRA